MTAAGQGVVLDAYPWGEWQSVRLEIDLAADSYSIWWGLRDQGPEGQYLAAKHVPFINGVQLDYLDSFTVAHFVDTSTITRSYLDNVHVEIKNASVFEGPILSEQDAGLRRLGRRLVLANELQGRGPLRMRRSGRLGKYRIQDCPD